MNRVKVWVFTLVVVALGFLLVRGATVTRRAEAVGALDARLASAAAHVASSTRTVSREASAAVGFIARDPRLAAALAAHEPAPPPRARKGRPAPPPADPGADEARLQDAARQALAAAERQFGFDLPGSTVVSAGNREWLSRRGDAGPAETEAMALLRAAIGGQPRRGFVRMNGGMWFGASAPAGEGAGVALLVPLDEAWAKGLATGAGADVTIAAPEVKPVSTAKLPDVPLLQQAATKHVAGAGEVGTPGKVDVSIGPVKLPRLPQPVPGASPLRARAIPIEGVKNGFAVVSIPAAAPLDAPAAFFWRGVLVLALVLVGGLVLGFFVRDAERPPQIPEALHAAAARIEKGDFSARAPQLAGKLGTVAAALNRAAEIAGPAQASGPAHAAGGAPAAPGTTGEWYQGPAQPAPAAAQPAPEAAAAPGAVDGGPYEVDEETHWQQVFQDFLRTRASCGEASEGLTYERFRQKLEGNKAQLAAKYGCKTVRFQVYVKDGKAALKATPVK